MVVVGLRLIGVFDQRLQDLRDGGEHPELGLLLVLQFFQSEKLEELVKVAEVV